jgi:hypothetical protein
MSVTTPPIFTPVHDEEIQFNIPAHEEVLRKLIQNYNFLANTIPVGTIIWVDISRPGVQIPDPNLWQICDGSQINNPDSPIATVGIHINNTPNLKNKLAMSANARRANPSAGLQTFNVLHNHGGATGNQNPPGLQVYDTTDNRRYQDIHTHTISDDLSATLVVNFPYCFTTIAYMKIV